MHAASEKKLAVSNDGVGAWLGALLYCVGIGYPQCTQAPS